MKSVRIVASVFFYLTRVLAMLTIIITVYAAVVIALANKPGENWLPIEIDADQMFVIFFPFTRTPFLLGDYTPAFLVTYLSTICFYAFFLWLLGGVFQAFKQQRLFSKKGFLQLSRFYLLNLTLPLLLLLLVALFGQEIQDIVRITFLHIIIGVFSFFMAAIFKQGLVLQEEQDLIF